MQNQNTADESNIAKVAQRDSKAVNQYESIGYAINLVMDYGNGRQVTISGTLPLGSPLSLFNEELDKLRVATNRQQAFVVLRDRQARLAAVEKMIPVLQQMLVSYEKACAEAIKEFEADAEKELAQLGGTAQAKMTVAKQQIDNARNMFADQLRKMKENFRVTKQAKEEELQRQQGEKEVCEVIIAGAKAEIGE